MNFLIKSLKISDHPLAPEDQDRGQVQLQVGQLGRVLHLQHNPAQDQNELENIHCCLNMFVERNIICMNTVRKCAVSERSVKRVTYENVTLKILFYRLHIGFNVCLLIP